MNRERDAVVSPRCGCGITHNDCSTLSKRGLLRMWRMRSRGYRGPVPTVSTHPASVAREAVPRHHPRWEPGALAAPAGNCAGAESNLCPYRDLLHRHVSAMEVGAVEAPMIRRSYPCKRSRCEVSFQGAYKARPTSWCPASRQSALLSPLRVKSCQG
jgi:hypothetical protein